MRLTCNRNDVYPHNTEPSATTSCSSISDDSERMRQLQRKKRRMNFDETLPATHSVSIQLFIALIHLNTLYFDFYY